MSSFTAWTDLLTCRGFLVDLLVLHITAQCPRYPQVLHFYPWRGRRPMTWHGVCHISHTFTLILLCGWRAHLSWSATWLAGLWLLQMSWQFPMPCPRRRANLPSPTVSPELLCASCLQSIALLTGFLFRLT